MLEDDESSDESDLSSMPVALKSDRGIDQSQLLLVSLLENFCSLYSPSHEKNTKLFTILCNQLSRMGTLPSPNFINETKHLRHIYQQEFTDIIMRATDTVESASQIESEEGGELPVGQYIKQMDPTKRESRYESDFEEIALLGRGAYGSVFKVRNKLDGNEYAIKKIKLRKKFGEKTFREVNSLARMDHVNIVRYHSAWVELPSEEEKNKPAMYLFIQMQLCKFTLRDWIHERNRMFFDQNISKSEFTTKQSLCEVNGKMNIGYVEIMQIMKQVLRGVLYIHSLKMIHRDLKPENIFFHESEEITPKIGDFGLVANNISEFLAPLVDCQHEFTSDIGTTAYSAPEQRNGTHYDEKVDIYSLGVILFEMLHPFNTGSERVKVLEELRNTHIMPSAFVQEWPKEAAFILLCIASSPENRPSAKEIMDLDVLDESNAIIKKLNDELKQKNLEIEELKRLVKKN